MKLEVQLLSPLGKLPTYGSADAAGADLSLASDAEITIPAGETRLLPTGIAVAIPAGHAGFVYARSGLASKRGLAPANCVGVIDADYRGEIKVALHNHSGEEQTLSPGERIAQLVLAPVSSCEFVPVDSLPDTVRGTGGFGSTGTV